MIRIPRAAASFAIGMCLAIGGARLAAQHTADVTLRAGMEKETVEGDLKGAAVLYERAAREAGKRRDIQARSLLRLGDVYRRLGEPRAREVYTQLATSFSDQKDIATLASARLAAIRSAGRQSNDAMPRRLLASPTVTVSAVSMDGRTAVGWDYSRSVYGDLVRVDMASGAPALLLAGSRSLGYTRFALSSDGSRMAFTAVEQPGTELSQNRQSLCWMRLEPGAKPQTLLVGAVGPQVVTPIGWSADGRAILTQLHQGGAGQFVWVSVEDGSTTPIRSFASLPANARLSPDGRFIAYGLQQGTGPTNPNIHIRVMSADGQVDVPAVQLAGRNTLPLWSPEGTRLLFMRGSLGLWSVRLEEGRPTGEPTPVRSDFRFLTGLRVILSSGALVYATASGGDDGTFIAARDGAAVDRSLDGVNATWSPDGQSIAYLRRRPGLTGLIVRSVASGAERLYPVDRINLAPPQWFHDSKRLLLSLGQSGANLHDQSFCVLDLASGALSKCLLRDTPDHVRSNGGVISADDATVFMTAAAKTDGAPWTRVVGVNVGTGDEHTIATLPTGLPPGPGSGLGGGLGLALSPDGATLAIQALVSEPGTVDASYANSALPARLITIRTDGTDYREVYGPFPTSRVPDLVKWTPDGRDLLFVVADRDGAWRLLRVAAAGGAPVSEDLTFDKVTASRPLERDISSIDVSPDGRSLLFTAPTREVSELWTIDNVLGTVP